MTEITPAKCAGLCENNKAVLVDVREPGEFKAARLEGSVNIPLGRIDAASLEALGSGQLVLVCNTGRRAKMAEDKLGERDNLCVLSGGLGACKNIEGLSLTKTAGAPLPLERQVQLAVSLMILSGLLIYVTLTPYGLILPLMAGAGLMVAALSGRCGMALFLARAPWNQ
jgi:rhodanese-related sulfurtransferase